MRARMSLFPLHSELADQLIYLNGFVACLLDETTIGVLNGRTH